jgi:hypothetical protein
MKFLTYEDRRRNKNRIVEDTSILGTKRKEKFEKVTGKK